MKKTVKLLLIIMLAISFASCKEIHCPAFPKELRDSYFPYSAEELLKFANNNNDTLEVKIKNTWISDAHSFPKNCDCECGAYAGFDTEMDKKTLLKINGTIHFFSESKDYYLRCEFYDSYLSSDLFETLKYNFTEKTAIFGDTIFMEEQEYYRIGSVKIVKNKGIVEFWDKQLNCNWIKIE